MNHVSPDPLRSLRETVIAPEALGAAEQRSQRLSGELAATIRRVPAQRRRARVRFAAFSTASLLVIGVVMAAVAHRAERRVASVSVESRVASTPVAAASAEPVVTDATESKTIELAGGATALLSPRGEVRVLRGARPEDAGAVRLSLREGKVELHVPHIGESGSLAVVTDDAEVVVHGTVFSVEVGLTPAGRRTCVLVTEGIVGVRTSSGEARLLHGEHWSSLANDPSCGVAPLPAALSEGTRAATPTHAPPRRAKGTASKAAASVVTRSAAPSRGTIAVENKLFRRAVVAMHRGDDDGAIHLFDELLAKYPDSALAPEATAQRREAEEHRQGRAHP
ncbi:MAG TPA: FecR domain-containing protein [Polyangiaceae bacterium]|jgi:hypothetical protein